MPSVTKTRPEPRWRSVRDGAAYAGVTVRTMRRWIAESRIPVHRIGRTLRLDLNEIDASLRGEDGRGA
jgi:excisionase family DNA binding protein